MRFPLCLCMVFLLVTVLSAEAKSPHWSLGFKGGYYFPDIDGWEDQYGTEGDLIGGIEIGRKLTRQLELSANINYFYEEGKATTVTGRASNDEIVFQQVPFHVSLIYRFVFDEDQLIVPYGGGGYTHTFYRVKLNDQESSGDRFGYHVRGGFQILLDTLEKDVARDLYSAWKIANTYLFFEGIYSSVDDFGSEDIDIGGWAVLSGILIEF